MEIKKLKKNALFNPEGDTELRLRKMIGGNTTNLNDFNNMHYKVGDNGDFLVRFGFGGYPLVINDNFTMENFLLDTLVEVVRHHTDKHPLCQI